MEQFLSSPPRNVDFSILIVFPVQERRGNSGRVGVANAEESYAPAFASWSAQKVIQDLKQLEDLRGQAPASSFAVLGTGGQTNDVLGREQTMTSNNQHYTSSLDFGFCPLRHDGRTVSHRPPPCMNAHNEEGTCTCCKCTESFCRSGRKYIRRCRIMK